MAQKFLKQVNGILTEQEAQATSSGASDAGKIVALNSQGKLDITLLPTGIGDDAILVTAGENLSAGDFVNIYDDSGTSKARKADASMSGKFADGFVLESASSGQSVKVYFEGSNNALTGLTVGAYYFLSDSVAGGVTATVPSGVGKVIQKIGKAINSTTISFEPSDPIILA